MSATDATSTPRTHLTVELSELRTVEAAGRVLVDFAGPRLSADDRAHLDTMVERARALGEAGGRRLLAHVAHDFEIFSEEDAELRAFCGTHRRVVAGAAVSS